MLSLARGCNWASASAQERTNSEATRKSSASEFPSGTGLQNSRPHVQRISGLEETLRTYFRFGSFGPVPYTQGRAEPPKDLRRSSSANRFRYPEPLAARTVVPLSPTLAHQVQRPSNVSASVL